jgi:hypothetical protein
MSNKATHARTVVGEGEEEEGEGDGQYCQGLVGEEGASHPDSVCVSRVAAAAGSAAAGSGAGGLEREVLLSMSGAGR